MKYLIYVLTFVIFCSYLNGQSTIEPMKESKRTNCILVNGLFGNTKTGFGFRYKSLYHLNDIVQLGWGLGIESYSSNIKRNFIPVSFDLVGDIFSSGRTPFYMISVGYGIALNENENFAVNEKGGIMMDFSIGYRSKKYSSQPFIAVGYRLQNAFYEGLDDYGNNDKDVVYKRWSVSAGILF